MFGIPSDRIDLFVLMSIIFAITALSLIILIVQGIKRKPYSKTWAIMFGSMLFLSVGFVLIVLTSDIPSSDGIVENKNEAISSSQVVDKKTPSSQVVDERVAFEDIYYEYEKNEIRADEIYQYNRYRVTAKINGMEKGGFLNLAGGATLTMEVKIGKTIVFFYAEFEKKQEEKLKNVNVGDTITFNGKCLSAGSWTECELIE